MNRLFLFLFLGPFWVQFIVAGGLGWVGFKAYEAEQKTAAAVAHLAEAPQPAPVAIEDYTGATEPRVTEVNLRVTLWTDHNYRLNYRTNFVKTKERFFMPFAPVSGSAERVVMGGLIMTEAERDAFALWAIGQPLEDVPGGVVVTLPGLIVSPGETIEAEKAMRKDGLKMAADPIYVAPFLNGRDAGIAAALADHRNPTFTYYIWLAAAVMALLGLFKLRRTVQGTRHPQPLAEPVQQRASVPEPELIDEAGLSAAERKALAELRAKAQFGFVPSGKALGPILMPRPSRLQGLVSFGLLIIAFWPVLSGGVLSVARVLLFVAAVTALQLAPYLSRARTREKARAELAAPRAGQGAPVPTIAPAVTRDLAPTAVNVPRAPRLSQRPGFGSEFVRTLRWAFLTVPLIGIGFVLLLRVSARLLPAGSAPLAVGVALSVALAVWLWRRGAGAPLVRWRNALSAPARGKGLAAEDPFERFHRQLRP